MLRHLVGPTADHRHALTVRRCRENVWTFRRRPLTAREPHGLSEAGTGSARGLSSGRDFTLAETHSATWTLRRSTGLCRPDNAGRAASGFDRHARGVGDRAPVPCRRALLTGGNVTAVAHVWLRVVVVVSIIQSEVCAYLGRLSGSVPPRHRPSWVECFAAAEKVVHDVGLAAERLDGH